MFVRHVCLSCLKMVHFWTSTCCGQTGHKWAHAIPTSIYTLLMRMDNPNTHTHSFTQIILTQRFPCRPPAVCEWCHLVSCRCSQPWCSSRGRPERSASLCRHQQTHPEEQERLMFFSWMNGSYGSHVCCWTSTLSRAVSIYSHRVKHQSLWKNQNYLHFYILLALLMSERLI